uniref:High osmolarity signaling protein SHO1 (Osmosensor SHO1) n=1 Tax=Ganoderma boninense TaxID=34458 RepID=A0A5K1JVP6_9APHY|nr:High osmolarity signaling protein SHO1 (Osmosensor SHO1) [Ganoderma boninense]
MPSGRKSGYFQPTVPVPPLTILSLETELTHFRHRLPLLLETELRPFGLRNHAHHPYRYPIPRREGTPEKDCLDWSQYPLTPDVAAAIRRCMDTMSVPLPVSARPRSRQPTPPPGQSRQSTPAPTLRSTRSRQSTPARQPTPGPSTDDPGVLSRPLLRRKNVRFPTEDPDGDDDEHAQDPNEQDADTSKVATPDTDGLIAKPDGEVGRHKRGYSLNVVLGWSQSRIKSVRDMVHSYVEDYLNHSLSASKQPSGDVESLTKLILAKNPGVVDEYRDGWPIRDMIYLRLKYTSGRFKCGQVVAQGKNFPQDLKQALKDIRVGQQDKGKQRAGRVVS